MSDGGLVSDGGSVRNGGPVRDGGPSGSLDEDSAAWHRLHPLSPLVSAGPRFAAIIVVLIGIAVAKQRQADGDLVSDAVVVIVVLAAGAVRWLVTRWQVASGVLRVETGLLRRDSRRFPLSQVQAIDVVQSGLARVLGLAELRLRVAGGDASRGGQLACLRRADAERLREQLLALAGAASATKAPALTLLTPEVAAADPIAPDVSRPAAVAPGVSRPAVTAPDVTGPVVTAADGAVPNLALPGPRRPRPALPVPGEVTLAADTDRAADREAASAGPPGDVAVGRERPLFRVHPGRLAAAVLLSRSGLVGAVAAAGLITIAELTGHVSIAASFLPVGLGAILGVWRQFSAEFGTTVADAPDGLRLRSGLIETSGETIRPGRVQAVRLVEPLTWRALGWCRLEVDIAGPRQRHENRSESQRLRTLIPVGSRGDAARMMAELISNRPLPVRKPPAAARWKAPLKYHFLAWGGDEHYIVTSGGRVSRKTTWIPLEKAQSIRWIQGPVQRRLGLATVRLDVAGRRVTGAIEDRAAAEAQDLLGRLPDLAREARARSA